MKPACDPKRAAAYLRVSTDEQALGPEAQREAIRRWAEREGVTVAATHEDKGVSGGASLDKRPGLLAALASLTTERAGLLVVAKRDRLARDPLIAAMVEAAAKRSGARVVSAAGEGTDNDDPTSLLMRRIVDAFAEYERLIIGARTSAALAVVRASGRKTGGAVPLGFKVNGDGRSLYVDEAESAILARIRSEAAAGASAGAIAASLNRDGVKARGSRWFPTTISRVLSRQE